MLTAESLMMMIVTGGSSRKSAAQFVCSVEIPHNAQYGTVSDATRRMAVAIEFSLCCL
jgi:hypothetical protein